MGGEEESLDYLLNPLKSFIKGLYRINFVLYKYYSGIAVEKQKGKNRVKEMW